MSQGYAHSTDLGEDVANVVNVFSNKQVVVENFYLQIDGERKIVPGLTNKLNLQWLPRFYEKLQEKISCRRDTLLLLHQNAVLMSSTDPPKKNQIGSREVVQNDENFPWFEHEIPFRSHVGHVLRPPNQ